MSSKKNANRQENGDQSEVGELLYVDLEKSPIEDSSRNQFFVLPAGGMHFAVPDLKFHVNHFEEETSSKKESKNTKPLSKSADSDSFFRMDSSSKESSKEFKHPLGLDLTAGPGQKKGALDGISKVRIPLPSETLFASAAYLKSYFNFSQEKDTTDKVETGVDTEESVKNKVMGLWHNMKYGWSSNLKTKFSRDTPIYLLGKVYHRTFKEDQTYDGTGFACSNVEGFKRDFASIGWFTYRRKFPPLPESSLTTDCGWGCMIRSGQMMMMAALRRHFLPPNWSFQNSDYGPQSVIHKHIMKFFCDDPSPFCPFSIHNLILAGHKMNKKAGHWYGPSCVAYMMKDAIEEGAKEIPALDRIGVYVAQDGAVYVQDVLDMCSVNKCICRKPFKKEEKSLSNGSGAVSQSLESKYNGKSNGTFVSRSYGVNGTSRDSKNCDNKYLDSCSEPLESEHIQKPKNTFDDIPVDLFVDIIREKEVKNPQNTFGDAVAMRLQETASNWGVPEQSCCNSCSGWKSCIVFIPVRLGGSSVNPIYHNCLYSLFLHDLCIGIIGGRPKHSLYFVGFQDDSLIHLDPHLSQEAIPLFDEDYPLSTYHCSSPRKISISKMDPSATIGFYCHTRSQFFRLLEEASMIATAKDGNLDSPIFEFIDGRSKDVNGWYKHSLTEEISNVTLESTESPRDKEQNGPSSLFEDSVASFEEAEELVLE